MHLSKVNIKGFRCLKDVEINLQSGLNVLVGRNNTGKTALLAAIRLALGPSATRNDSVWLTEEDYYCEQGSTRTTQIYIELTFAELSEKQRALFFEITDFNLPEPEKSTASIRFEANWPKDKKRPSVYRWGGPERPDRSQVASEILEPIPKPL